jgi:hypothetical protein
MRHPRELMDLGDQSLRVKKVLNALDFFEFEKLGI